MELLIISGIVIVIICVFITRAKILEEKSNASIQHSVRLHGQDIFLDQKNYEEYRKKEIEKEQDLKNKAIAAQQEKERRLRENTSTLKSRIADSLTNCKDELDKMVYEKLLFTEVKTEADYNRLNFMYNNGHLRSNDEVHDYDWQIECQKFKENFNYERHKVNIIAFFLPFITVFSLVTAALWKSLWFISLLISTFLALIVGLFGMIVGYKYNLSNAKLYGISDDDKNVRAEKVKLTAGIIGAVGSAGATIHHTKKAVKDITNVDSWKEFK